MSTPKHCSCNSSPSHCSSRDVTAASSEVEDYNPFGKTAVSTPTGEALLSDYSVNKLPDSGESCDVDTSLSCSEVSI